MPVTYKNKKHQSPKPPKPQHTHHNDNIIIVTHKLKKKKSSAKPVQEGARVVRSEAVLPDEAVEHLPEHAGVGAEEVEHGRLVGPPELQRHHVVVLLERGVGALVSGGRWFVVTATEGGGGGVRKKMRAGKAGKWMLNYSIMCENGKAGGDLPPKNKRRNSLIRQYVVLARTKKDERN